MNSEAKQLRYADHLILEWKISELWWQKQGLSYTGSGYGNKIPNSWMVRLYDSARWYRVYTRIFSNIGTCYIVHNGEERIIANSFPKVGLTPRAKDEPLLLSHYLSAVRFFFKADAALPFTIESERNAIRDIRAFINEMVEHYDSIRRSYTIEDLMDAFVQGRAGLNIFRPGFERLGEIAIGFGETHFWENRNHGYLS